MKSLRSDDIAKTARRPGVAAKAVVRPPRKTVMSTSCKAATVAASDSARDWATRGNQNRVDVSPNLPGAEIGDSLEQACANICSPRLCTFAASDPMEHKQSSLRQRLLANSEADNASGRSPAKRLRGRTSSDRADCIDAMPPRKKPISPGCFGDEHSAALEERALALENELAAVKIMAEAKRVDEGPWPRSGAHQTPGYYKGNMDAVKLEKASWSYLFKEVVEAQDHAIKMGAFRATLKQRISLLLDGASAVQQEAATKSKDAQSLCEEASQRLSHAERQAEELVATAKCDAASKLRLVEQARMKNERLIKDKISEAGREDLQAIHSLEKLAAESEAKADETLKHAMDESRRQESHGLSRLAAAEQKAAHAESRQRQLERDVVARQTAIAEGERAAEERLHRERAKYEDRLTRSCQKKEVTQAESEALKAEEFAATSHSAERASAVAESASAQQKTSDMENQIKDHARAIEINIQRHRDSLKEAQDRADANEIKAQQILHAARQAGMEKELAPLQQLEVFQEGMARMIDIVREKFEKKTADMERYEHEHNVAMRHKLESMKEEQNCAFREKEKQVHAKEQESRINVLDRESIEEGALAAERQYSKSIAEADGYRRQSTHKLKHKAMVVERSCQPELERARAEEKRRQENARNMESYAVAMMRAANEAKDSGVLAARANLAKLENTEAVKLHELMRRVAKQIDSVAAEERELIKQSSKVREQASLQASLANDRLQEARQSAFDTVTSLSLKLELQAKSARSFAEQKMHADREVKHAQATQQHTMKESSAAVDSMWQEQRKLDRVKEKCRQREAATTGIVSDRVQRAVAEMDARISGVKDRNEREKRQLHEMERRLAKGEQTLAEIRSSAEDSVAQAWRDACKHISDAEGLAVDREREVAEMHEWMWKGQTALLDYYSTSLSKSFKFGASEPTGSPGQT